MTDVTDYDAFYEQLMTNYADLKEVALDKLATEELVATGSIEVPSWVPGTVPGTYGNAESVDFEGCEDALSKLASSYLGADYAELESMSLLLDGAMLALNGPADGSTGGAPGIDPTIGDIHGGLSSWDSEAGELFTANFVDTIGSRKTNQYNAIDYANRGVATGMELLVEARTRALKLPVDTKKALEDYNPWSWLWWSGAKLGLIGIGMAVKPVAGLLLAFADNQLVAPDDSLTVAGVISKLVDAAGDFGKDVRGLEDELAAKLDEESKRVEEEWSGHVCSKPIYIRPTVPGSDNLIT